MFRPSALVYRPSPLIYFRSLIIYISISLRICFAIQQSWLHTSITGILSPLICIALFSFRPARITSTVCGFGSGSSKPFSKSDQWKGKPLTKSAEAGSQSSSTESGDTKDKCLTKSAAGGGKKSSTDSCKK